MIPYERHEAIMNLLREKSMSGQNSLAKHSMSVWRQSGGILRRWKRMVFCSVSAAGQE